MSLSFNCPQCKAHIQVSDELAGQSGQCPRCEHVFVIPAPNQPMPTRPRSDSTAEKIPPSDPWAQAGSRAEDKEPVRRRRRTPMPAPPSGPVWPWVLGIGGALVVGALLLSSFFVLVLWRRTETPIQIDPHTQVKPPEGGVVFEDDGPPDHVIGRLEGQRAIMKNGVFQIRTNLTQLDIVDPKQDLCRCKRYEIELRADRNYVIEQESNQFDSFFRIEEIKQRQVQAAGRRGARNARLEFAPIRTGTYIVYASSEAPALGEFTLTIRERNVPRPKGP